MTSSAYAKARDIFRTFRLGLEKEVEVLDEILQSVGILITEYDTSIRENRFIVGGGVERIMATAMRSVGITSARARGLDLSEEDIIVGDVQISVKSSFTRQRSAIRLVNTLGDSPTEWTAPTIFLLADRGIGYADPGLLPSVARKGSDAVQLPRPPLDEMHDKNPEWLLKCDVPMKSTDASQRRAASEAVINEILQRKSSGKSLFPRLSRSL